MFKRLGLILGLVFFTNAASGQMLGEGLWKSASVSASCSLSLDFTGGSLPGGVTLTRASSATYYSSIGAVSTAATNAARFTYNPATLTGPYLWVEPAATNVVEKSETLNGSWSPANITVATGQAGAPSGGSTASLLTPDTSNNYHGSRASWTFNTGTWTYSYFAKANGYNYTDSNIIDALSFANGIQVFWNVSTGAYVSSSIYGGNWSIVSHPAPLSIGGSGYYRVSITFTSTDNGGYTDIYVDNTGVGSTYAGDGTSGVYAWGVQLESGSVATSYISSDTGSSTTTRAADVVTFTQPSGCLHDTYTFDDNSTQTVAQSSGSATIPTNLNRPWIKSIAGAV